MNFPKEIEYSEKYYDDVYEYKHIILNKETFEKMPRTKGFLKEEDVYRLGIVQTKGWVHYSRFKPEPHILLFRRPIGTNPTTGKVDTSEEMKI